MYLLDLASDSWGNLGIGYSEWRYGGSLFPSTEMSIKPIMPNNFPTEPVKVLKLSPATVGLLKSALNKELKSFTPAEVQAQIEFWNAVRKRRHLL